MKGNKLLIILAILVGIFFVILTLVYWAIPARSLPTFMPGYEPGVLATHIKHGIGTLLLAFACFAFAWFQSGKKSSTG